MRELQAISELAARAADPADPLYAALTDEIAETSGLHATSLAHLVSMWAQAWQLPNLERALRRGLGPHPAAFRPVGQVAIVAPGNLCVATWQAIAESLLVGNRVKVRASAGDPRAVSNFCNALRLVDAKLADRVQEHSFARGDRAAWLAWLRGADALLVYGGDAAIAAILQLAAEAQYTGRLRLHGHFSSIGVLATDLVAEPAGLQAAVAGWAVDALLADGRGCMSLRALWLVGPIDDAVRQQIRHALAAEFARAAAALPAGQLDPRWEAERQLLLQAHTFDAAVDGGRWVERGADWAILGTHGPIPAGTPTLGPGGRTLMVYEAAHAPDLLRQLTPWQRRLSTASMALDDDQHGVLKTLEQLIVHRTCQPGAMQAPRADRAPDGHPPFTGLVRLADRV